LHPEPSRLLVAIPPRLSFAFHELAHVARRAVGGFITNRCLIGASALSYATLLALLPLTVIVLVIFSDFPVFANARERFLVVLLRLFAPEVGETAAKWFEYVATNAAQTTVLGIVALAVTALLLLATIEEQLNVIWNVTAPRTWLHRVLVYWMVLTLGPVLLGTGLSLPTYLQSFAAIANDNGIMSHEAFEAWLSRTARFLPFLLETGSFALLFRLMPNCPIRIRDAVMGALVAAALMEALKLLFALYVARFSSYSAIYGALAGIPILLLWMYIFWAVVLLGAEIAAALGAERRVEPAPAALLDARRSALALALLAELERNRLRGGVLSTAELAARLGLEPALVEEQLTALEGGGFVAATAMDGWVLARALGSATLRDMNAALQISFAGVRQEDSGE
jgi:membrane protein